MFKKFLATRKCKHQWKLLVNKELESAYEQLIKQGETLETLMPNKWGIELFQKTAVIIMVCEHCGEVERTVVSSSIRNIQY